MHPAAALNSDIPFFAPNGTALSHEERVAIARRKGKCVECGEQTHRVNRLRQRTPLTNENVYQGSCLRCCGPNTTSVPRRVRESPELRNRNGNVDDDNPGAEEATDNSAVETQTPTTGEQFELEQRQPLLLARVPLHLHNLIVSDPNVVHAMYQGAWYCDNCNCGQHNGNGHMWRCQNGCDYDLCDECIARFARRHDNHPHHDMIPSDPGVVHRQFGGAWFCDGCQPEGFTGASPQGPMWRCIQGCDFDLCDNCMTGIGIEAVKQSATPLDEDETTTTTTAPSHCVICLDASPSIAFIPCGHLAACTNCTDQLLTSHQESQSDSTVIKCPVCRQEATSTQRIFF